MKAGPGPRKTGGGQVLPAGVGKAGWVEIPLIATDSPDGAHLSLRGHAAEVGGATLHAQQILLVDDEERFLATLARLLNRRGFEVRTAASGGQALEALASGQTATVIVLDVRMPGMDGLEALRRIKGLHPACEVIMLSGEAALDDAIEAVRGGAFDYIQKPCEIDELEAKIRSASSLEQIKRYPVLWPRSEAGEVILSGFVPLLPQDSLRRALEIFNRYRHGEGARMLFVVDESRGLKGLIKRGGLLKAYAGLIPAGADGWDWLSAHADSLPHVTVESIMQREAANVAHSASLAETARLMLKHNYDSMPVTANGTVLGVVRLRDVLGYLQISEEGDLVP